MAKQEDPTNNLYVFLFRMKIRIELKSTGLFVHRNKIHTKKENHGKVKQWQAKQKNLILVDEDEEEKEFHQ
jgi:hypothetical protein